MTSLTRHRSAPLLLASILACAGCDGGSDPSDGGPDIDAGNDGGVGSCEGGSATPANCPMSAPDHDLMCGACCFLASNADRLDMPMLRLTALRPTAPSSLSNAVVRGLLTSALDEERFNWIYRVEISGSSLTAEMGYGERNPDGTFSFVSGVAPAPGDPNRWDSVTATGTLSGDTISTDPLDVLVDVPIFESAGSDMITAEFPQRQLQINGLTLSHDRSCVGERRTSSYSTDSGSLTSYITVEDAKGAPAVVGPTLDTTLCMFLAGRSSDMGNCDDMPQTDWPVPPDSTCDDTGCTLGGCTPATCNAWQIKAELGAHGIDIVD